MVVVHGMNVYPSAIEEAVRQVSSTGEFRITFYTERSGMDEVKLEVELTDGPGARRLQESMRQQLGFEGLFLPTYGFTMARGPYSQFPDALDPALSLVPYHGDLGLEHDGCPFAEAQMPRCAPSVAGS